MSITTSPTTSHPRAAKFTLVSAITLGLIGGPVALAAPADASTRQGGCTVDPLRPTDRSHGSISASRWTAGTTGPCR